ncbi:hypothetical protein MMC30_003350 [Trapelia coarctata]|nr:hypothetical protein [Trapelia coarctata]
MKFPVVTAVLTLATLAAGSPIAVPTNIISTDSTAGSIEKRSETRGGLYACTDDNFRGHYDFSADLASQISSIGPEPGSSCNLYPAKGCAGPSMIGGVGNMNDARYPGYPKLKDVGLDNFFVSYRCEGVGIAISK